MLNQKYVLMNLEPSEMFKVLSVDTRVRIIELLKFKCPLGANNIAELIGVTSAAVSQHLKILRGRRVSLEARERGTGYSTG